MEKTLARAIFKEMEIGKVYTITDLRKLIGDDYYKYIPAENYPNQKDGFPVNSGIAKAMWNIVNTGYAKTYTAEECVSVVRGRKMGSNPIAFQSYKVRNWVRIK